MPVPTSAKPATVADTITAAERQQPPQAQYLGPDMWRAVHDGIEQIRQQIYYRMVLEMAANFVDVMHRHPISWDTETTSQGKTYRGSLDHAPWFISIDQDEYLVREERAMDRAGMNGVGVPITGWARCDVDGDEMLTTEDLQQAVVLPDTSQRTAYLQRPQPKNRKRLQDIVHLQRSHNQKIKNSASSHCRTKFRGR